MPSRLDRSVCVNRDVWTLPSWTVSKPFRPDLMHRMPPWLFLRGGCCNPCAMPWWYR